MKLLKLTEARDEQVAITCSLLDRGDRTGFTIGRQYIAEAISSPQLIDFEDINEIIDLRNVLNEMIDRVQSEG